MNGLTPPSANTVGLFLAKCLLTASLGMAATAALSWAAGSITVTENAGVAEANHPVRIGRPFAQGEIANCPQAVIAGSGIATQANVMQRWPDGSVKHAIVSFLVPSLPAGGSVAIDFLNQTSCNTAPLTQAQMLDPAYNFDARMELTNGTTVSADARAMLTAGSYTVWAPGSIAQTVIIVDHSQGQICNGKACSNYDIGFDAYKSFRPIFIATFWPAVNKVQVRFVGEIANTETLQDQIYSLVLKTGNASPSTVYTKTSFTHTAMSRWTRLSWIGGAPSSAAIDHNLPYLTSTKALPNYDTSKSFSSTTLTNNYAAWSAAAKDLYGAGLWQKAMGTGGARPDIGPYPSWIMWWIYSFDSRMEEIAFGNTDLGGAWPTHMRDGAAGKNLLRTDTPGAGTGVGRILSISNRPTFLSGFMGYSYTNVPDRVTAVGTVTSGGWTPDAPHFPESWSVPYLLTGDFWYLEELWFMQSWVTAYPNGASSTYNHRGPTGAEGVTQGDNNSIRETAWALRTRAHIGAVTPDGRPEKAYFEQLLTDDLAAMEGARNITGTALQGNSVWNWGRNVQSTAPNEMLGGSYPPQHQWWRGFDGFNQTDYGICSAYGSGTVCTPATTFTAVSLFELDYLLFALGRAKELGYPSNALLKWLGSFYTGGLTDPAYNPRLMFNGRVPTVKQSDGTYFSGWADLKTGYRPEWQALSSGYEPTGYSGSGPADGYAAYVTAGVSYLTQEANGVAAWNWLAANVLPDSTFDPKWAIVPRPAASNPVSCDLNQDGRTDVLDVQLAVNRVLGLSPCGVADLNQNGRCDIADLQRIINAVLGGACLIAP